MASKSAEANSTSASSWTTYLKITIDLSKRSFSPSFRCSPVGATKNNVLCSCLQITSFNINESKQPMLFDFPLDSNKPRFVFYDPARVESARQLCEASANHNTRDNFLQVVKELLESLAKICQGKATPDLKREPGDTNLKPFRTDISDNKSVCKELRAKICAPLNPSEIRDHGLGYIYILRSQSFGTLAELKIGFSKHHPEHRAHQLAGCLRNPEVVAHSTLIPHANRIEAIIHAELVLLRKTQLCAQCQQEHKEWFTISHIHARQVVTRWCRWVLNQPYQNGVLTSQWKDHLNKQDFSQLTTLDRVSKIWTKIIDTYQIDESMESADKQRALYVNAMFLEKNLRSSCDALQLPALKGNFEDIIQIARAIQGSYGIPNSSFSMSEAFDPMFSHLFGSVIDFTPPQRTPLKHQHAKQKSSIQEVKELAEHIISIKTGCLSVGSPELGISESPMGDATLLPIVSLKELEHFNGQAKLGIGYNPTNVGFQFLQEAYHRGDWEGPLPRFKKPKGPRFSDAPKPSRRNQAANVTSQSGRGSWKSHDVEASGSYRMKEHELRSANAQEPDSTIADHEGGPSPKRRKIQTETPKDADTEMTFGESTAPHSTVRFTRGEDGEKSSLTFSRPVTDKFMEELNKITEEIKNGGRQKVERRLNKVFRYYGIETMIPSEDDDDDENDSWVSEDGDSPMEGGLFSSPASPLQDPTSQNERGTTDGFSKNAVAAWFQQ